MEAQRLAKVGYANYTGEEGEADKMPEYKEAENASDNSVNRNALDKICMQFTVREDIATKAFAQNDTLKEEYQVIENCDALKKSNVPNGMTLDCRIWGLALDDR